MYVPANLQFITERQHKYYKSTYYIQSQTETPKRGEFISATFRRHNSYYKVKFSRISLKYNNNYCNNAEQNFYLIYKNKIE